MKPPTGRIRLRQLMLRRDHTVVWSHRPAVIVAHCESGRTDERLCQRHALPGVEGDELIGQSVAEDFPLVAAVEITGRQRSPADQNLFRPFFV